MRLNRNGTCKPLPRPTKPVGPFTVEVKVEDGWAPLPVSLPTVVHAELVGCLRSEKWRVVDSTRKVVKDGW